MIYFELCSVWGHYHQHQVLAGLHRQGGEGCYVRKAHLPLISSQINVSDDIAM